MKKYIIFIVLVLVLLPQLAFASWWNPFSWSWFKTTTPVVLFQPQENLPVPQDVSINEIPTPPAKVVPKKAPPAPVIKKEPVVQVPVYVPPLAPVVVPPVPQPIPQPQQLYYPPVADNSAAISALKKRLQLDQGYINSINEKIQDYQDQSDSKDCFNFDSLSFTTGQPASQQFAKSQTCLAITQAQGYLIQEKGPILNDIAYLNQQIDSLSY